MFPGNSAAGKEQIQQDRKAAATDKRRYRIKRVRAKPDFRESGWRGGLRATRRERK